MSPCFGGHGPESEKIRTRGYQQPLFQPYRENLFKVIKQREAETKNREKVKEEETDRNRDRYRETETDELN